MLWEVSLEMVTGTPAVVYRSAAYGTCRVVKECASVEEAEAYIERLTAAMMDKTPYGDVMYADPGYQADKKKRYPIDTAEHCRAAWSYINQAGNAAKYTPEQVASIKAKIKAAAKKCGVEISD